MFLIRRAVTAAVLLLVLASQSRAQTVILSEFLESNFKSSLIVMEGDRWIDDDTESLTRIVRGAGAVREKLALVAEQCDYEVEVYDGGYLLRKRYTDWHELPCVSREELVSYGEDAKRASDAVFGIAGASGSIPHLRRLVAQLSPEQWERIQKDKLAVSDLNGDARRALDGLVDGMFHDGLQSLSNDFIRACGKLPGGALGQDNDKTICLSPPGVNPSTDLRELNAATYPEPVFNSQAVVGATESDAALLQNASFGASDLQSVVTRLNRREDGGNDGGIVFACTKALLHTPVSVVGLNNARSPRIMRFIARLYDLDLIGGRGTAKLSCKSLPVGGSLNLGRRLAAGLPLPLRRTLAQRRHARTSAAVLSPLIPQMEKAPLRKIPVDTLSRLQQSAIVFSLFDRLAGEINDMKGGLPQYLTDDERLYVRCRRIQGVAVRFTFFFEKDGKFLEGAMVTAKGDVDRKDD